jgi:hypothetical protein
VDTVHFSGLPSRRHAVGTLALGTIASAITLGSSGCAVKPEEAAAIVTDARTGETVAMLAPDQSRVVSASGYDTLGRLRYEGAPGEVRADEYDRDEEKVKVKPSPKATTEKGKKSSSPSPQPTETTKVTYEYEELGKARTEGSQAEVLQPYKENCWNPFSSLKEARVAWVNPQGQVISTETQQPIFNITAQQSLTPAQLGALALVAGNGIIYTDDTADCPPEGLHGKRTDRDYGPFKND